MRTMDLLHVFSHADLGWHRNITTPLCFLQEWSWTPVKPGVRCLNARRCAACSRAPRASPPPCPARPVTPSSAPAAGGPGRTAIPALSASPWSHPHPLMRAGRSASPLDRLQPQSLSSSLKMILCWKQDECVSWGHYGLQRNTCYCCKHTGNWIVIALMGFIHYSI